jgi:hypothetical protein
MEIGGQKKTRKSMQNLFNIARERSRRSKNSTATQKKAENEGDVGE